MARYEKNRKSLCVAFDVSDLEWLKAKSKTWKTSVADVVRYAIHKLKWESEFGNENQ